MGEARGLDDIMPSSLGGSDSIRRVVGDRTESSEKNVESASEIIRIVFEGATRGRLCWRPREEVARLMEERGERRRRRRRRGRKECRG